MKKEKRIEIRVSELEYKIIQKKAEMLDTGISEYIRQAAVNKKVNGFKVADLNLPEEQCKGQLRFEDVLFKEHVGRNRLPFPDNWEELYEKWEKKELSSKEFIEQAGVKRATFFNMITEYKEMQDSNS